MNITERIGAANRIHQFEAIARDVSLSPECTKHSRNLQSRLYDLNFDLPKHLGDYCKKLMQSENLIYEEIHKIFSLAESISILCQIGIDGANEWSAEISADIRRNLSRDARYEMVREDIFGDRFPDWWIH